MRSSLEAIDFHRPAKPRVPPEAAERDFARAEGRRRRARESQCSADRSSRSSTMSAAAVVWRKAGREKGESFEGKNGKFFPQSEMEIEY
ncbi:hypothetical protein IEQ34_019582 [Dendrobium chrysotoxum]|uniref:Uncharacterized protein n=1 Tax=Dendrobium chrysotoxum TaxID=161865 RepID=A0AAV7GAC8_DENCH|nr:hypothetical protein IEQ34_019582 [Dendrobium chrysotoxum]